MTTLRELAGRVAVPLLAAHVALVVFSTAAFVTILADPSPETQEWLAREPNATVFRLGWRYSGPAYVVLGFAAALAHAASRLSGWRVPLMFFTATAVALATELLGTSTGFPFGGYSYTPLLGYRVLGLVPVPIAISWAFMLYCALAICGRLLPAGDDLRTRLLWAALAAAILTAWDVALDPAMVRTSHWIWHEPGPFYGMPFSNWIGWLATAFVIAWLMLRLVPPGDFARHVSPTRFPLVLYAVNGVMPVAICFRFGMPWAGMLGIVAMAVPVALAFRAGSPCRHAVPPAGAPPSARRLERTLAGD